MYVVMGILGAHSSCSGHAHLIAFWQHSATQEVASSLAINIRDIAMTLAYRARELLPRRKIVAMPRAIIAMVIVSTGIFLCPWPKNLVGP